MNQCNITYKLYFNKKRKKGRDWSKRQRAKARPQQVIFEEKFKRNRTLFCLFLPWKKT